jgi:ribosomal protein L29
MKNTDKSALRQKSVEELRKQAQAIRDGMLKARVSTRTEGKGLSMKYRSERRQLARIETIISEKASAAK